jgi:hypothetical protein
MPGQARKFTDEQRIAVVRAVLIDGMTQLAAIEAAKSGELIEGQPFEIARGTLQNYLRRAAGDARESVSPEQIRAQLLSALKREIDAELPKLSGRKKLDFITQALHAVKSAETERNRVKHSKKEDPSEEDQLRSESLERLAEASRTEQRDPKAQAMEDGDLSSGQPRVANSGEAEPRARGGAIANGQQDRPGRAPSPPLAPTT